MNYMPLRGAFSFGNASAEEAEELLKKLNEWPWINTTTYCGDVQNRNVPFRFFQFLNRETGSNRNKTEKKHTEIQKLKLIKTNVELDKKEIDSYAY